MGKESSPPPAPDYRGAAIEQGAANKETAIASNLLNNPNVSNPFGTQTWTGGADGTRPTMTQTFSPEQQALYMKQLESKGLLADLGTQGATALQGVVGKNLDLSGAPTGPGSYGDMRDQVIGAQMARVNEDAGRSRDSANSELIAAGIRPGSKAYDDRMNLIQRGVNDATNVAVGNASGQATQAFQTDAQRRKDAIAELLASRQTPLNEINALMSGSQVSNPFAVPGAAQNTNIAPPPIFGAAQAQYGASADAYNAEQASQNSMMSGLMGIGAAGMGGWARAGFPSDRRLKSNIVRIGDHPLGIGIYEYDIFGKRDVGVMADEVLTVRPEAVITMPNGYYAVDYGRL